MDEQIKKEMPDESQAKSQMETPRPEGGEEVKTEETKGGNNKAMAIIGYILPILFFIPLVTEAKNDPFAKFHANQHLVLLLAAVAVNIVGSVIPILGWFIILPIGSIALIILAIMGIINAAKGEMKQMPLIGGISIIK